MGVLLYAPTARLIFLFSRFSILFRKSVTPKLPISQNSPHNSKLASDVLQLIQFNSGFG